MRKQIPSGRSAMWLVSILCMIFLTTAVSFSDDINRPPIRERLVWPPVDLLANSNHVPNQLVIRLAASASLESFDLPGEVLSIQTALSHAPVYLLTLAPGTDAIVFANNLSQWTSVAWAHPNYLFSKLHPIQGSYPFPDQNYTGDFDDQYSAAMLNLTVAQTIANGSGVTIGIIDGGIDFTNPALNGKAVSGYDYIDGDSNALDEAGGYASGHGTFVAGVAHLMSPEATLRAYRVFDNEGDGDGFTLAQAIEDAVDDGCDVINLSLALTERHMAVAEAIDYAASHGVVVVAGSGNDGSDALVYPAAEINAIAVASIDSAYLACSFTNYGSHIDVCAPGNNIYSTFIDPDFAWWSGTSFSAAFTSGLAALVKDAYPTAHGFQVRDMIVTGATDLDLLNPQKSGELGSGVINPVASLSSGLGNDTAAFFPAIMFFEYFECSENPAGLNQVGYLMSTNAPAAFSAQIEPSGGVTFVSLESMTGMTDDSIRVYASTAGLTPGTYRNIVAFTIDGIEEETLLRVQLDVLACNDSTGGASVNPSELWFTALTGSEITLLGSATLSSSNAPAPFYAEIVPDPAIFVTLIDTAGVTNDSVRVQVHPSWLFSAGSYTNVVNYYVEGISNPVSLTLHLSVTDSIPQEEQFFVYPDSQTFVAPADTFYFQSGAITVVSSGAPAAFTASILDFPDFTELTQSSGMTIDSVKFEVTSTPEFAPGFYADTIVINIDGAPANPYLSVVRLWVTDEPSGGDTAIAIPASQSFYAPGAVPTVGFGSFIVYSSGSIHPFTVSHLDPSDFTLLINSSGNTGDSVQFQIVPSSPLPGIYTDTLRVDVSGVSNSPLIVVNTLIIDSVIVDTLSSTAAVYPYPLTINTVAGGGTLVRQVLVTSSNAPADFIAYTMYSPGNFVQIPDSLGTTSDSLTLLIQLAGLDPGSYVDTVVIFVNGVPNPIKLPVELNLSSGSHALEVWNYPNPFNPVTEIGFILPAESHVHLEVFNVLGQKVATLIDQPMRAGEHSITWDGRVVASGVYYYRISAGALNETRKMLLVK